MDKMAHIVNLTGTCLLPASLAFWISFGLMAKLGDFLSGRQHARRVELCIACSGTGTVFDPPEQGYIDDVGGICADCNGGGLLK